MKDRLSCRLRCLKCHEDQWREFKYESLSIVENWKRACILTRNESHHERQIPYKSSLQPEYVTRKSLDRQYEIFTNATCHSKSMMSFSPRKREIDVRAETSNSRQRGRQFVHCLDSIGIKRFSFDVGAQDSLGRLVIDWNRPTIVTFKEIQTLKLAYEISNEKLLVAFVLYLYEGDLPPDGHLELKYWKGNWLRSKTKTACLLGFTTKSRFDLEYRLLALSENIG